MVVPGDVVVIEREVFTVGEVRTENIKAGIMAMITSYMKFDRAILCYISTTRKALLLLHNVHILILATTTQIQQ